MSVRSLPRTLFPTLWPPFWPPALRAKVARKLLSPEVSSALLTCALYAVTLGGTWIYDDTFIAWDDPRLHLPRLWLRYLQEGFFPEALDNLWRPLTSLSFALQWEIHGAMAPLFHLVNILLNAAACVLVAHLGRMLGGKKTAYVAGLLFAALPVHVEAVAYLVGRAETMATIGILGAIILFLRRPHGVLSMGRVWAIFGCFWFAALSKEHGLLVPVMLLAWGYLLKRKGTVKAPAVSLTDIAPAQAPSLDYEALPQKKSSRLKFLKTKPGSSGGLWLTFLMTASLAAYVSYRNYILPWFWESALLNPVMNPLVRSRGMDRWAIVVSLVGRYAAKIVLPIKLSIDYGLDVIKPQFSLHDPYFYIGIIIVIAYFLGLLAAWRWRKRAAMGCLICIGLSYILISNVFIIGTIFNERLIYLCSAFVCVLIGLGAQRLRRRTIAIVLTILVVAGSIRTVAYAARWNNRLTFFETSLAEQPHSTMLYLLLDEELERQGRLQEAARVLAQGREMAPDAWSIWYESARLAFLQGDNKDASRWVYKGFPLWPGASPMVSLIQRLENIRSRNAAPAPATATATTAATTTHAATQP